MEVNNGKRTVSKINRTDVLFLLSVIEENHGYAMMQDIQMLFYNRVRVGNATMYNLLERFMNDGIIELTCAEPGKKYYKITAKGLNLLKEERMCLKQQIEDSNFLED